MNRKIEKRRLIHVKKRRLIHVKPHPRQAEPFSDANKDDLRALAEDIEKTGQLVPIETLPDGTVISGHRRVAAAHLLGWTES